MTAMRSLLSAMMLLALVPASPAEAGAGTMASCVMESRESFSPGIIGTKTQRVASTTHGETGTITCVGKVNGHDVTGPGTMGFEGFFDISCLGGTGEEAVSLTIPTTAGLQKFSFTVDETVLPPTGYKSGGPFVGPVPYVFYPTKGDCVTSPITEVAFAASGVLRT